MRRVLFVVPHLEPGGAERVVTTLLRSLSRERFELHLALVVSRGRLLQDVPGDVPVHDLAAGRVRWAPLRILALVRRLRPDVVFSTLGYLNFALLLLRGLLPSGTPVVVREAVAASSQIAGYPRERLWRAAYRWLYPRADAVVCPAQDVIEDLVQRFGVPRGRTRYIPNPVDVEQVAAEAEKGGSPYGGGAGPHLLGAGRLEAQKGFDLLIDAFARLAGRLPDAQLWILGEGPERGALEARVSERGLDGRVHLVGHVANPHRWMRHADVFALSSRWEGLPNALLEALACGTRVAAFDAPGGVAEIVRGVAGAELAPLADVGALAERIASLLERSASDPPTVLPSRYELHRVIAAYEDLLADISR
jgi:glycosyltransferase involved in cell wall biosynthesis